MTHREPSTAPECILDARAQLGECPRWDERAGVLYWVDILGQALHRFDPSSGVDTVFGLPEAIGCFSLGEDGGFIAGLRSGIWRLDDHARLVEMLAANPEDTRTSRFNDGRCDPHGRFLVGTVDEPKVVGHAHLYQLAGRELLTLSGGLLTSNGLAFSPDGRWLYHSDTPNFTIYRYPYDPTTGAWGARAVWVTVTPTAVDRGRPDGAAVDAEGYYWSAFYEGGRVVRFTPDGQIDAVHPLPVRCPTMCAFGGSDLRTLYITTARAGRPDYELAREPLAGGLFALRTDVPGCIEPRWRG
ncbi:6-deoxy-6-sulfogluconolactonase [Paraburkholderia aspalathi]|uniref:SMP-30/gluconolactonase/LRE family protein n=1 Tax=Paraburkholderia aspalathi TaxID=1324617 RepID=UPI00190B5E87|nr:SMP-30/gluconolactonase/LRE family protein [Paraburkholderia aspalathi]MBK3843697.1 SMP-30/gluconolactonase/LRE family protein [Paraburkholderia aspalathi]CAE6858948.1 6-deoxy-6-sulfogluconolactonase [Paraburkholderia aspalathi]